MSVGWNRDIVHQFELEFTDGTTTVLESWSFPWIYREWLVIADLEEQKVYYPRENVVRFTELVEA